MNNSSRVDVMITWGNQPRLDRKEIMMVNRMNEERGVKIVVQPVALDGPKSVDVREECLGMSCVNSRTN